MHSRAASLLLLLALLPACAARPAGPRTGDLPAERFDSHRLTQQEIHGTHFGDIYQVVRTLRPIWLRERGMRSFNSQSGVVIYLDNVPIGGPETLQSIPTLTVRSLQFLDAGAATQRWGTGHIHGAILVQTR